MKNMTEEQTNPVPAEDTVDTGTYITATEVLAVFEERTSPRFEACFSRWFDHHSAKVSSFCSRMQTFLDAMEMPTEMPQEKAWQQAADYVDDMIFWLDGLDYVAEGEATADSDEAEGWWMTLPVKARLPVDPEAWQPASDDTGRIRRWKARQRLMHRLRRSRPIPDRVFSLHALILYYLEHDYQAYLIEEQTQFLRLAEDQINRLKKLSNQIGQSMLFEQGEDDAGEHMDMHLIGRTQEVVAALQEMAHCHSELAAYREAAGERFARWKTEVSEAFHQRWVQAGCSLLPEKKFSEIQFQRRHEKWKSAADRTRQAWFDVFKAQSDDWRHELSMQRMQARAGMAFCVFHQEIKRQFDDQIIPAFITLLPPIKDGLERVKKIDIGDQAAMIRDIDRLKKGLVRVLRRELLPPVMDAVLKADLEAVCQSLEDSLTQPVGELARENQIITEKRLDRDPPDISVEQIPIKALLEDNYLAPLKKRLADSKQEMTLDMNAIVQSLAELDQVVEFNLDAALSLLNEQQDVDETIKTVHAGLDRAREQVDTSIERSETLQNQVLHSLLDGTGTYMADLQTLANNDEVLRLKLALIRAQAQQRYRHIRHEIWTGIKRAVPYITALTLKLIREAAQQIGRMRRFAGLEAPPVGNLEQFLTETHRHLDELPFVYRRVFDLHAIPDPRFFGGRDAELETMQADFDHWRNGHYMTTALVGEGGSGSTTLIQFARDRIYRRHPIHHTNLDKTCTETEEFIPFLQAAFPAASFEDMDSLEAAINDFETPCICIIENLQNLFIKTVTGFDLLERFLQMISRTHRQVYWIVTCNQYSWEYLQKVVRIHRYFQRELSLNQIKQKDMERLIMTRHRVTGYHMKFNIPPQVTSNRRFKKIKDEDDQQAFLRSYCFENLHDVAMGNVSVGILFWLRAIDRIEDHTMYINPMISFDESALASLSMDEMFALGAVLQQDTISAEILSQVFHQDIKQSRTMMDLLTNRGILTRRSGNYRIHPFLYRPVALALKRLNILH